MSISYLILATVELFENNDFLINDKYIFMVGDPLMDYDRIKELDNAFAAIYGQPKSQNNKLPIWLYDFVIDRLLIIKYRL